MKQKKLTTGNFKGTVVNYVDGIYEVRKMLSEHPTQLLAQAGSAVAIARTRNNSSLEELCERIANKTFSAANLYAAGKKELQKCGFEILISHRTDNGKYSLIGGARNSCEDMAEVALRETYEETGMKLQEVLFIGMITGGDEMINIYPDGNAVDVIDALYLGMVPRNANPVDRQDKKETIEFVWMTPDEIIETVKAGKWHPAQVKTITFLVNSLPALPLIYSMQNTLKNNEW